MPPSDDEDDEGNECVADELGGLGLAREDGELLCASEVTDDED